MSFWGFGGFELMAFVFGIKLHRNNNIYCVILGMFIASMKYFGLYVLSFTFIGRWAINGICIGSGYRRVMDIQMRAKRKGNEDFGQNVVASLASGGGGYGNCRAISPIYSPRTPNQKTYVQYLAEPETKIVLGVGAAGSGKTLFACYSAIQELRRGTISKIVMTRPVVPVEEEEIGFLPGSLINKMDPWTRPIFDILFEFYSQKDIDAMLHSGVIEISPLAYMRGRTFKRAFIIADEMQNSSPNQMLMLTTRLGEGSKMVITGDLKQSDRGANNGLADLLAKLKDYDKGRKSNGESKEKIKYVELESSDVQRSAIVSKILDIYGGKREEDMSENIGHDVHDVIDNIIDNVFHEIETNDVVNDVVNDVLDNVFNEIEKTKDIVVNNYVNDVDDYVVDDYDTYHSNNDAALIPIHHMSKYMKK